MADALKAQEQNSGVRELSFVERLSLLVDRQWNWRENKSLARRLKSAKLRHNACIEDIDYRAARGVVALLGHVMLGEYMSWLRCAGITAISMGVFIVSRTNPQTTEDF